MADTDAVLQEIVDAVRSTTARASSGTEESLRDLRWRFDQVSAKMNQAIYNDQRDLIHDSTLRTIEVLIRILARTKANPT